MSPSTCSSQCGIRGQASHQRTSIGSLSPSSRRSPGVWGSGYRSAARSSGYMADDCGRARMSPGARRFNSHCLSIPRVCHLIKSGHPIPTPSIAHVRHKSLRCYCSTLGWWSFACLKPPSKCCGRTANASFAEDGALAPTANGMLSWKCFLWRSTRGPAASIVSPTNIS